MVYLVHNYGVCGLPSGVAVGGDIAHGGARHAVLLFEVVEVREN